jgi:hypothetical protein
MTEEKAIQFACPVCKSVWAAKASMAGTRKACPKCKTEIIIPSASPTAPAPQSVPAVKKDVKPTEKKPLALLLLMWVGLPVVFVIAAVIVFVSTRKTDQNPPPVVTSTPAKPVDTPVVEKKEVPPPQKSEPSADDKWMKFAEGYLKVNENKCSITKTYPTEAVVGVYYRTSGVWLPIDRPPMPDDLASASSASQAGDLNKLKDKPLDQITLDDLVKIQNEELQKIAPNELRKLGIEPPKAPTPEELKKKEEEAIRMKEAEVRKFERIRAGRAIRVEYDADEGFGRIKHRDEVFVIDAEGNVVHRLNIDDFRLGKPQEKK